FGITLIITFRNVKIMRTTFLLLLFSVSIASYTYAQFNPEGTEYSLVWQEEFDKNGAVNPAIWSFENGFVRNNELQWYQEKNAEVVDGNLIIYGKKETVKNTNYNSESKDYRLNGEYAAYTSSS